MKKNLLFTTTRKRQKSKRQLQVSTQGQLILQVNQDQVRPVLLLSQFLTVTQLVIVVLVQVLLQQVGLQPLLIAPKDAAVTEFCKIKAPCGHVLLTSKEA